MLCQFSFENYKSFKNQSTLDFYAEDITEHKESLIVDKTDNEKFLPVAVIYGPNGGGKSNTLEALYYAFLFVLSPVLAFRGGNPAIQQDRQFLIGRPVFHKFSKECEKLPSKFDILLRDDEYIFNYQLSAIGAKVVEENLYYKKIGEKSAGLLFERTNGTIKTDCLLKNNQTVSINEFMPFLSFLAISQNIPIIEKIIACFKKSEFLNYSNPIQELQVTIPENKPELKEQIFETLNSMGINIFDARTIKENGKIIDILMKHKTIEGSDVEISISDESAGTRKVFSVLAKIIISLKLGRLVVMDELDSKLHPKLLKYIIQLFTNPEINRNGAQLLFTSHDIYTMSNDVFRRDEIWFCALNKENASKLYSLSSIRKNNGKLPRKDEVYSKQYLEGRYGADPYFRKIQNWGIKNDK